MSGRQAHNDAVNAASAKVEEMRATLGLLLDEANALLGMVGEATGGFDCPVESGQNAFSLSARLVVVLEDEPRRVLEMIDAELVRYDNGF